MTQTRYSPGCNETANSSVVGLLESASSCAAEFVVRRGTVLPREFGLNHGARRRSYQLVPEELATLSASDRVRVLAEAEADAVKRAGTGGRSEVLSSAKDNSGPVPTAW